MYRSETYTISPIGILCNAAPNARSSPGQILRVNGYKELYIKWTRIPLTLSIDPTTANVFPKKKQKKNEKKKKTAHPPQGFLLPELMNINSENALELLQFRLLTVHGIPYTVLIFTVDSTIMHTMLVKIGGSVVYRERSGAWTVLKTIEFYMIFIICHLQPVDNITLHHSNKPGHVIMK